MEDFKWRVWVVAVIGVPYRSPFMKITIVLIKLVLAGRYHALSRAFSNKPAG